MVYPKPKTWTAEHRRWMSAQQFDEPASSMVFADLIAAVDGLTSRKAAIALRLSELASDERWWPTVDRGVFLIDLKSEPKLPGEALEAYVPDLVARAISLRPSHVIAIKANVCDMTQQPLRAAGLHVVDQRIPFPGSGQQRRFWRRWASHWIRLAGMEAPLFGSGLASHQPWVGGFRLSR
jgi:hypothetical protein